MKIRSKVATRTIGLVGGIATRALVKTIRIDRSRIPDPVNPWKVARTIDRIGAVWHDSILLPTALFGGPGRVTLISQSGDGDIATALAENLGWRVVRGSSTRGGVAALRELMAAADGDHIDIAIPVDGPKGPRRQVKEGAIYLAARTGLPLMPLGLGYDRAWNLKSWDRFQIPKPFCRACIVFGGDIVVPANVDREAIAVYRDRLQAGLDEATARAEAAVAEQRRAA